MAVRIRKKMSEWLVRALPNTGFRKKITFGAFGVRSTVTKAVRVMHGVATSVTLATATNQPTEGARTMPHVVVDIALGGRP
jgi:hypothetical protein